MVQRPLCQHCKKKRVKLRTAIFCSAKCYTDSGRRSANGKVNGKKWVKPYWKRFIETFDKKHGHLSRERQIALLLSIGRRSAYRGQKMSRQIMV